MICVFDSIDMRVLSMQGIYSSDRAEGWKDGNLVSGDSRYIQAQSGTTYKAREDSSIYHHTLLSPTSFYLRYSACMMKTLLMIYNGSQTRLHTRHLDELLRW